MIDRLQTILESALRAIELFAHDAVAVNPWWMLAGVIVHYVAQIVRLPAWRNIIRAAYPKAAADLSIRDVGAAFFAGSGLNAVIPARGGDVVKLAILKREIDGSKYSTLAATFVPEGLFESIAGTALVIYALARGFLPVPTSPSELPQIDITLVIRHAITSAAIAAIVVVAIAVIARWLSRRGRRIVDRLRLGLAIFRRPRDYLTGVVTWQAFSRVIRLGELACFMAAFHLPVTLETTILVMAAQGGGRIIPIAPASAGLRLAMLSYGFVEITDQAVDIASLTAFTFGVSTVLLATGFPLSLVIVWRRLGTLNPRRAVTAARTAIAERVHAGTTPNPPAPAPTPTPTLSE